MELLARTAALTRNELNEMISVWLDEMAESHTTVTTGRYVEAYINEQKCKTITLPVIEFEELEYQKTDECLIMSFVSEERKTVSAGH